MAWWFAFASEQHIPVLDAGFVDDAVSCLMVQLMQMLIDTGVICYSHYSSHYLTPTCSARPT
jgi:hypothetical protein